MTTPGTRLVWRAADAVARTPAAVVEPCGRCGQPSLVDRLATPDPAGTVLPLVCVPCALADPEMRDDVLRTWKASAVLANALPPAFSRKGSEMGPLPP